MKPDSIVVKYRSVSVTIYPVTIGGRLNWRFRNGDHYITRAKLESAREEAKRITQEIYLGAAKLGFLTQEQTRKIRRMIEVDPTLSHADEFILWHSKAYPKITVAEALSAFLRAKETSKGASAYNVTRLRQRLEHLPGAMLLSAVTPADLPKVIGKARTRANHLGAWTTFFRWCQRQGYLPAGELTAPERIERPKIMRAVPATWTRAELEILIAKVSPQYLPWLTLGAWAGIRTEEVCPDVGSAKDAIRWEDFAWDRKVLIVRPEVSKTNQRRIIPMCDALVAILRPLAASGRVVPGLPPHRSPKRGELAETSKLGQHVGGWKRNALRHSWVSYRAALIGIAGAAQEAGNSESVSRRAYQDAMSKADAVAWFQPLGKVDRKLKVV